MKPVAFILPLSIAALSASSAFAQSTSNGWDQWPTDQAPAQQTPAQQAPPVTEETPAPAQAAPAPATGQWVWSEEYGWIWVPNGATTYAVGGDPYVYIYTPVYGWTWYASPWGWGPYYYGVWAHRPWGWRYAPHVWYGRGWMAPRFGAYYHGRVGGHWGGYRGGYGGYHGGFHGGGGFRGGGGFHGGRR
jgi:uncharacterized membrane protein YgcG